MKTGPLNSSYFLFFSKHSNPFVKTQTKDCSTETSLKSMHTIKNNYFFCPQIQNMDQALKVNVLVTQQFS